MPLHDRGPRISRLQSANSFTCAPVILREASSAGYRCSVPAVTDWCTGMSLYRSASRVYPGWPVSCMLYGLVLLVLSLRASRVMTSLRTQSKMMSSASSELARPPEPEGAGGGEGEEEGGPRKA